MARDAASSSCASIAARIVRWPASDSGGRPGRDSEARRVSSIRSASCAISEPSSAFAAACVIAWWKRWSASIDWLVRLALEAVDGRAALVPWVMFGITGTLTAIGAVSPGAVAIVAPVALACAAQYKISPLLMGAMIVHGAQAGGFSPISVYGTMLANAQGVDREVFFKRLMIYGAAVTLIAPLVVWIPLVLLGIG